MSPLAITFPESLPVSSRRDDIAAALTAHQVIIVCGETGSGKTTQLPKIALALGRGKLNYPPGQGKLIGHTQPRRIAASSVAKRIAEELKTPDAWKADPGGEAQQLLDDWTERYGTNGSLNFYRAVGCDKCNKIGYKGRIGLHELMIADDAAKKLIQERARVAELFASAVNSGMRTLKMDGMEKVLMGLTDLKMVRSVCIK